MKVIWRIPLLGDEVVFTFPLGFNLGLLLVYSIPKVGDEVFNVIVELRRYGMHWDFFLPWGAWIAAGCLMLVTGFATQVTVSRAN